MFRVHYGKRFRAAPLRFLQGGKRVRRFAALTDEYRQRVFVDFRAVIAEFARHVRRAVQIGDEPEHSRARKSGMICRAAADKHRFRKAAPAVRAA